MTEPKDPDTGPPEEDMPPGAAPEDDRQEDAPGVDGGSSHDFGPEPWESAPPAADREPAPLEAPPAVRYGAGAPPEAFAGGEATYEAKRPAFAVYLLYLAAFMLGLPAILGVMLAYSSRAGAPGWLGSHYTFQIRTFWIGLAGVGAAGLFLFLPFGMVPLILMAVVVWVVLRCFVGMVRLHRGEPIYNPQTWIA